MEVPAIKEIIDTVEVEMAGNGRVLVRPSGTEPLVCSFASLLVALISLVVKLIELVTKK